MILAYHHRDSSVADCLSWPKVSLQTLAHTSCPWPLPLPISSSHWTLPDLHAIPSRPILSPPHPIHFYLPWNCHGLTNQSALSPQNAWSKSFPFTYFNLQWPSPPWSLVFWPLNCPKCVGWESEITENWWKQVMMLSVGQWPVFKLYLSISHKQLYLLVPFEQWPQIISKYVYQNCRDKYGLKWIIDKGYKMLFFFWKLTNQTTCLAVINPFNVTVLSTMLREANKSTKWKIETELVLELVRMQWKYSMSFKQRNDWRLMSSLCYRKQYKCTKPFPLNFYMYGK